MLMKIFKFLIRKSVLTQFAFKHNFIRNFSLLSQYENLQFLFLNLMFQKLSYSSSDSIPVGIWFCLTDR